MNIPKKYCNKLIKLSLRQNMREYGQRNPYSPIFYAVFETMIGPINPNHYIHWLNKKIVPEVYLEPSQTSEMKLFVKIRSRHSELFLKTGVTIE